MGRSQSKRVYTRLSKALGGLSKDEFTLMKELYYNGNSSGDIIKKVTDFRSGAFVPKKFEDVDTKINRLSKDLGTGETSRNMSKGKPNTVSLEAQTILKIFINSAALKIL